jgi:hypothetical protein
MAKIVLGNGGDDKSMCLNKQKPGLPETPPPGRGRQSYRKNCIPYLFRGAYILSENA